MKNTKLLTASLLVLVSFSGARLQAGQPDSPAAAQGYHLLKTIPLSDEGFWDYLTADSEARRLYVTRGNRVTVVDLDSFTVIGELAGTAGVHGVAIAPDLGRGFTSNGRADTITIFDTATIKPVGEAKSGKSPDAIIYDPASHRVFAFNGRSSDATAIEASSGSIAGTVVLNGRPEGATADGKGRVYVNLEDKSAVAVIDSLALSVTAQWSLSPCEEPSGLAMDTAKRRLFAGCANNMMAIVNADNGVVISTLPIGEGVDACAFDPAAGLAFSSNGEGTLTVVREETPEKFTLVENAATHPGARTMALDTKTHNVFLITADFGPAPAATPEHPRPRKPVVPGTVRIMVLGR